jgi:pilus assembly protein CpaE
VSDALDTPKILVLDRSEELAERVRAITAELSSPPEIVSCTKIGSASHVNHEHEGPFAVLVAGPSLGTKTGLKRLALLHRDSPSTSIVMAFESRPDATLREIIQVGADDVLELPSDDTSIKGTIKRALELAEKRYVPTGAAQQYVVQAQGGTRELGKVYTVSSATGGCGKTFYATNIALLLSQMPNTRVALVDLDLQFGEVSTALRLHPTYTIYDVLKAEESEEAGDDFASHLGEYLVEFEGRFSVLAAPKDPAQADRITPVEVTKVIETLRAHYDYVVVDTPTALAETVLAAFDLSEHLFLMCTLDLPSVRNLGMFLQTLQKLRISSENVSLILNKVEKDVGISVDQITKLFPQGFQSTLPYAKEVSRSINVGKPVLESFPETEVSKKLALGFRDFLPEDARDLVAPKQPTSGDKQRFFRLFRRHSAPASVGVER